MCERCKELFTYDKNDVRPNIWHECKDGIVFGIKNPNLKQEKRQWTPPPKTKEQVLNKRLKDFYGR